MHCVKSVQIRSFCWSVFSLIQSEYGEIRTRKNSVFGHFSRSDGNTSLWSLSNIGTKSRCWISLIIGNSAVFIQKVTNVVRKYVWNASGINLYRNALLWAALRVLSFFFVSLNISSTLTHENWNVHLLLTLTENDTWILGCLLYLKIAFNIKWYYFMSKGADLLGLWDL